MAKSGLKHIDVGAELTKTEWESEDSHELIHGTSFPGSPVERQLFYRDDEHKWYIYDGSAWVWLGGGSGGGMEVHGNEYHDPDFATEAALAAHAAAATGVHGVGAGTVGTQNKDTKIVDADGDTSWDTEQSPDEDKIHGKVKGVEAFLLDDAGILTLAKQSAAKAYLGTEQTIPNTTWTVINLDTELYDIQDEFNTTTHRFTAKKAGIYMVAAAIAWINNTTAKRWDAAIFKNGSAVAQACMHSANATDPIHIFLCDIAQLAVNDYLDLRGYQNSGSSANVAAYAFATYLAVYKLA